MTVDIRQGDARNLDLPDNSVDLIVTSPPYFGLRDYGTPGQLGAEPTPAEFIDALIACTAEMVRVLKPSGSIFVNLGDKYAGAGRGNNTGAGLTNPEAKRAARLSGSSRRQHLGTDLVPAKSLMLLPERYRIRAVDELGLIARAVLIWSKPNGLPESVTDRVRRSHEDWVHLTKAPRYFASVDEIREPHAREWTPGRNGGHARAQLGGTMAGLADAAPNPLGKLPGSVWTIATQPLKVPADLGVDHFAAYPMEWPRRLIQGWCPREVCTVCGEGRRPVVAKGDLVSSCVDPDRRGLLGGNGSSYDGRDDGGERLRTAGGPSFAKRERSITGYACACPDTSAPSTPGVVLDPFGGTGTTALVASMLGRHGISVDLSADYCRLAEWRVNDPKQRERAARPAKRAAA